ncbi:MAG: hypothetical protein LBR15_07200 [Methanobrevibacter sp.]|jgi:hypothetical protein|nr:hypothetical protein [Candidatus Methanovirga australis]
MGKEICDNINSYTHLRDDFIFFFDKVVKIDLKNDDFDIIIKFLEKIYSLKFANEHDITSWNDYTFANFKFFIHELFLYLIAIGLKNENYVFIEEILYSAYFLNDPYSSKNEPKHYNSFFGYIDNKIKSYYNEANSNNFLSPMADLMIKRSPEWFDKDDLINADLLCHYVSVLPENKYKWFPITYIYIKK